MAKHFEFADFVEEFRVDFKLIEETEGYYDQTGKWIPGGKTEADMYGIILPLTKDDVRNDTNGRYTEMDRKLYTLEKMVIGSEFVYKGQKYTIDAEKDYEAYADVYVYYAKGVGEWK